MFDTSTHTAAPISDFAIIVNDGDNVAVVKSETAAGLTMQLPDEGLVTLPSAVRRMITRSPLKDAYACGQGYSPRT
jgi:hypothetical protein